MSFEVDEVLLENDPLLTPAGRDEARLVRILYQRRSVTPVKDDANEDKDSSAVNSKNQCLSNVCKKILKMMWLLLFCAVLLIFLFLVLIEFCLGRCSIGQACSHSPLRMILGQYIQYTHTGEVPV